jgi:hypothetical protein
MRLQMTIAVPIQEASVKDRRYIKMQAFRYDKTVKQKNSLSEKKVVQLIYVLAVC